MKCKICKEEIPKNRIETCSEKCFQIWFKGFKKAFDKIKLPKIRFGHIRKEKIKFHL
jgi:hypothetical protein